ncbi:MAG: outer membrane beta-barrel protein [Balneolales bacterium]
MKVLLVFVIATFCVVSESQAQLSIGATYENKQNASTNGMASNGFGIQLERDMSFPIPLIFLRTRAHYSYFTDSNRPSLEGVQFDQVSSYDFGVGAILGANIALFSPYAGFGVGLEDYSRSGGDIENYTPNENEFYYQVMGGVGLNVLPIIQPFIELRYSGFNNRDEIADSQKRLMFGVALRF